jgi:putative transposase
VFLWLFGDEDCFTYLHWLGEALTETGGQLRVYAFMTNHVHLLVTPHRAATVPKLMISPGGATYSTLTRRDSRYKSSLIQAEAYLLTCMRYVELNPVRATMVEDPAHYRWTSYRANALGQTSPHNERFYETFERKAGQVARREREASHA